MYRKAQMARQVLNMAQQWQAATDYTLADARKATDAAIRQAYDVLNALAVLSPSASLSALINVLFGIEEHAKLYYISGGKTGGDTPTPTPDGGSDSGDSSDSGDVTPVTPDPTPDPTPSGGGDE